ncbi:hypothetical protein IGI04_039211 [Brassica rapa subsp. trilocularis]|uniref:Uncharacterized protein n=1 Tax=Brassica rapa subsp. trilocularis TaxID=1813537 RepID=A0ABQ7KMA6_BRACM|nr:hypothetical protein IGI04_039211 [Brassica rapa subsp. trilocularis]
MENFQNVLPLMGRQQTLKTTEWVRDLKETTWTACGSALTPVMLREMTTVENPVKHPVFLKNCRNLQMSTIKGDMKNLLLQANSERQTKK